MDKPEHDRILDIFQSGRKPTDEEWQWVNRYLALADKALAKEKAAEERSPSTLMERVEDFLKKKVG